MSLERMVMNGASFAVLTLDEYRSAGAGGLWMEAADLRETTRVAVAMTLTMVTTVTMTSEEWRRSRRWRNARGEAGQRSATD